MPTRFGGVFASSPINFCMVKILLIGPQGSGKDTQAKMLGEKFKIPYISMGNIFRDNIREETILGKIVKKYISKGKLVPDLLTNKLIKKHLAKDEMKKGFILDGYPRNISQAKFLDKTTKLNFVVEIYIKNIEVVKRVSGLRSCRKCGAIYHMKYKPPKSAGICEKCGARLYIRKDDKKEKIKQRLKIYHSKTEKLLKFYKNKKNIITIDGEQSIEKVFKDIVKAVKNKK